MPMHGHELLMQHAAALDRAPDLAPLTAQVVQALKSELASIADVLLDHRGAVRQLRSAMTAPSSTEGWASGGARALSEPMRQAGYASGTELLLLAAADLKAAHVRHTDALVALARAATDARPAAQRLSAQEEAAVALHQARMALGRAMMESHADHLLSLEERARIERLEAEVKTRQQRLQSMSPCGPEARPAPPSRPRSATGPSVPDRIRPQGPVVLHGPGLRHSAREAALSPARAREKPSRQ